jgi:hypothetical protein
MNQLLTYIGLYILVSPLLLWPCFYYLFHIEPDMTTGKTAKSIPYYIIGIVVVILYFTVDVTWGTLLFLQWPSIQRLMLSTRMDYIIVSGSSGPPWLKAWRLWEALRIVGILLAPYDKTGQHSTHGQWPVNKESNANA